MLLRTQQSKVFLRDVRVCRQFGSRENLIQSMQYPALTITNGIPIRNRPGKSITVEKKSWAKFSYSMSRDARVKRFPNATIIPSLESLCAIADCGLRTFIWNNLSR